MARDKIKVLYIHHGIGIGGATISLAETIDTLDKDKFEATVLLLKDSAVKHLLEAKKINFIITESVFYSKYYKYFTHSEAGKKRWFQVFSKFYAIVCYFLSKYYFANKVLRKLDFDIIHLNSSVLTDWLEAAHKKAKTVIHIREPFSEGYVGLRKWFLTSQMKKYADRIVAISNDNARRIGISNKTTVVYNFTKIPACINVNPQEVKQKKIVLYLGGAARIKGFYLLVDALKYIKDGINVYFAGHYPNFEEKSTLKKLTLKNRKLKKALHTIQSSPNAVLVGFLDDVSEYIKRCDVLVSPFNVPHFSRPIIEAFAYKKPSIATDVEGMDEIIDHRINGLLIKNNDNKQLAEAINDICYDEKKRQQMGISGYRKAKKLFSPDNVCEIEKIYEAITKNP